MTSPSASAGVSDTTALLLAVLRDDTDPNFLLLSHHEWRDLLEAARNHRVAPLVWHRIAERSALGQIPESAGTSLHRHYLAGWLGAQSWQKQLEQALAALHEGGVPAILLKGAYLARHAYPDAALRPMGDIDLLLPASRMRDGRDALERVGYTLRDPEEWRAWEMHREHRHPPPLAREGCLSIELHDVIEPTHQPFSLPLHDVWSRAAPVDSQPGSALALSPEDLLLHLATHMGRSHLLGSSLVRVCDVAFWSVQFGATADWDAVMNRARQFGMRRFVYTALELARRSLGASIPEEPRRVLHSAEDDAVIEHALALLAEHRTIMSGSLSLTRPDRWAPLRFAAAARALTLPTSAIPSVVTDADEVGDLSMEVGRQTRGTGWKRLLRLLKNRGEVHSLLRGASRVRELRAWADDA